jgi:hypothetical protein
MAKNQRLIVFSDDWGRHPSSCQHLVRHLLPELNVTWVNTIGMRAPQFSWSTVARGFQKLRDWTGGGFGGKVATQADHVVGPTISNPIMWPWFRTRFDCAFNRRLLQCQLRSCLGASFGVTTVPIMADVMDTLGVETWTYYCVDDWSNWVGLDHKPLAAMEMNVLRKSEHVIAASESLQERLWQLGFESELLTHGVDTSHWQEKGCADDVSFLDGLERPLVVQWGMINQNLDLDALAKLSNEMSEGTIVLVGPEVDPDPRIDQIDRLVRFRPIPYSNLPSLAHQASVLVMAYRANKATVASQPLKLKEYMATGKSVVARCIPATKVWADAIDLYTSPQEFAAIVQNRLSSDLGAPQVDARTRLGSESWEEKARLFASIVTGQRVDEPIGGLHRD